MRNVRRNASDRNVSARYWAGVCVILVAALIAGAVAGKWLLGRQPAPPPPVQVVEHPETRPPDLDSGQAVASDPEPPDHRVANALPSQPAGPDGEGVSGGEAADLRAPELPPIGQRPAPPPPSGHGSWSVLTRGPIQQRVVALTIDLGDTATRESVTGILELLHSHGTHCTWFVTGWFVDNFPDLTLEIQQSGHDLGNHTVTHPYCTSISPADFAEELQGVEDRLAQRGLAITQPKYFRPPYGAHNSSVVRTARELGYRTVMWSATSTDYDLSTDPRSAARAILGSVGPGGIILTHATPVSHAMMPTVVDELEGRGYDIVSLQDVIDIAHGQVVF